MNKRRKLMPDKTLKCKECGANFEFTENEQAFYKEKGFENEPQRCPDCRRAKKQQRGRYGAPREMFSVICAECGKETTVPFKPSNDKPVYCKECFQAKRNN